MKKCTLLCFLIFSSTILVGMNKDLYFLCNEIQECCTCLESVIDIRQRSPKGSVFALPCCYTGDKAKREEDLDLLVTSAQHTHDALLAFNFDLSNPLLPLAQQYDLPAILTTIDDEASKRRLEQAITAFDTSLVSAWQTITTRYYYQTADYFMVEEQPLVTQLQEARANVESSILECKKHKKSSNAALVKILCAAGVAGTFGFYWATANPLKRWGLFDGK